MSDASEGLQKQGHKWSMGILNDPETEEVPGSILLLSKVSQFNEPLGLRNAPARTSASSLPSPYPPSRSSSTRRRWRSEPEKKRTADGEIVLEPQPDDSANDPLNWAVWRRDLALLSLGFYCMLGGGMTPVLAAGFKEVAADYEISVPRVALTTGLYMMGLGVGSVILSPTAILFGKRPVYLVAATCFILTSIWCGLSPNFASLVTARVFQGIAVSSVECLPSATIAEIFFLHEKAYRLGIYTLLLLGGKNLVPLVSAAIIQSLHWRWVFYIVAIIVGFGLFLLFFFVPETFWDRAPVPHNQAKRKHSLPDLFKVQSWNLSPGARRRASPVAERARLHDTDSIAPQTPATERHAHFQVPNDGPGNNIKADRAAPSDESNNLSEPAQLPRDARTVVLTVPAAAHPADDQASDYFTSNEKQGHTADDPDYSSQHASDVEKQTTKPVNAYVERLRPAPPKTYVEQLKPYSGRLSHDNWFKVAVRPFILFAYPSILWSTLIYSLSIGWLIVLSESVATIYENRATYNFTPLATGLVYISPFVGGVLGTAVAGKVSDVVVRALSRRNGGIYEPEFRLVMAIPIAIFTTIGLMGYGWSVQERDAWIVPTIFFGFISFGCSLGSTTAITFAVDSYRQYAGEALVTLNFSKNIFHGLVFSLFFNKWLDSEGSKDVFVAIGGIQIACLLTTIPMYIYGKRARMWTVRRNLMEKF
jgi:MFS family permease